GVPVLLGRIRPPWCTWRARSGPPKNGDRHLWVRAGRGRVVPRDGTSPWRHANDHGGSGIGRHYELAVGNRCISVGPKTQITNPTLLALGQAGVRYISTRKRWIQPHRREVRCEPGHFRWE